MRLFSQCLILMLCCGAVNPAMSYNPIMTPEAALQRLIEGNERFMKDSSFCPDRTQDRRAASAAKQKPFAIVLGCSDSRVPPELAFDQGIGDIFVVRVAGNVVGGTELASIEYSAIYNHSAIVVVLGHESCGAVTAVVNHKTAGIEPIAELIKPAVNKEHHSLDDVIENNIRNSVKLIREAAPIAELIKERKIDVVGAFYNLNTGKIRILPKEEP